jgi:ribosome recycling factor
MNILEHQKKGSVAMRKVQDTYKEVKTFTYQNAVVRVHIPDLTTEEREKRMNELKKATARFMKAVEKERAGDKSA